MKRLISILLFITILTAALPAAAVRGYQSYWIECENSYNLISGAFVNRYDANSSGGYALKLQSEKEEPAIVDINFNISKTDEYDIYVLSLPFNTDWASPTYYKFNDDDDTEYTNAVISSTSAYVDSMLGVPVVFQHLTTRTLEKGANKMTFNVPKIRPLADDYMLSYLDAIIIAPKSWNWKPVDLNTKPYDLASIKLRCVGGKVSSTEAQREGTIKVDVQFRVTSKVSGNPKLFAQLTKNGEVITTAYKYSDIPLKQWGIGIDRTESFELNVPFCAPDGVYDVVAGVDGVALDTGEPKAKIGEVTIGGVKTVTLYSAKITDVTLPAQAQKGETIQFGANVSLSAEEKGNAYVSLWKDGLLYDVIESTSSPDNGVITASGTINADLPAGLYKAKVGVHHYDSICDETEILITGEETGKEQYYKPMSYGNYRSVRDGSVSFWYINQGSTCIWDGEPYVPMGGMFCSQFIVSFNADDNATNIANFATDKADLDKLRSLGISHLYLNPVRPGLSVPAWAFEYFFDYLEETGWTYGLQLGGTERRNYDTYFPRAALGHVKVENITESSAITAYSEIFGGSSAGEISCTYLVIDNETGEAESTGKGSLSVTMDNQLRYDANITVNDGHNHTVYFMPYFTRIPQMEMTYWVDWEYDVEQMREYCKWLSLGRNLRFIVDPTQNEMGFYNNSEITRVYDENFNKLYSGWLSEKYRTIDKLNDAWLVNVSSFDEASRLVPIFTENNGEGKISYTYSVDGDNPDKIQKSDTHLSLLWNDYLDGRDKLFAKFNNEIADAIKESVDVPVIFKHCSIQREYLINRDLIGGFDGLGTESYGPVTVTRSRAATTSAITDQFARTAWRIITETNTEENVMLKHETGEWSYPSEEHFNEHFDKMFEAGMKGGFNFLLTDRFDLGGILGEAYSTIMNEKEWPWWQPYLDKHEARIDDMAKETYTGKKYYFYPSQKNWWYAGNERSIVQLCDDNIMIERFFMPNGDMVMQTDDPTVEADIMFVNLTNGPYSNIFGGPLEETMDYNDRIMCVIGFRDDLGTIPSIDKYYTNEKIQLSESKTVQILKPTETSQILLSTDDGKPYALKDGNIIIIAVSDLFDKEGEYYTFRYFDLLK